MGLFTHLFSDDARGAYFASPNFATKSELGQMTNAVKASLGGCTEPAQT